jgi:hypothetical protein
MVKRWILPAIAGAGLVGAALWYALVYRPALPVPASTPAPPAPPAPAAATVPAEVILHPVPPNAADAAVRPPLPTLNDSDPALLAALEQILGVPVVKDFFVRENLVRRIVVSIDNLARPKLSAERRPIAGPPGLFQVQGDELHATLDPQNYARYRPLVAVVHGLDMQRIADLYFRFYPLFQSAYQDLGYPTGYFNDRLIAVIDVLLATPQPMGPLELVRPRVMYEFADAGLEALPSGQKILLRMGPDNAVAVKDKLAELRAILTAAPTKH